MGFRLAPETTIPVAGVTVFEFQLSQTVQRTSFSRTKSPSSVLNPTLPKACSWVTVHKPLNEVTGGPACSST